MISKVLRRTYRTTFQRHTVSRTWDNIQKFYARGKRSYSKKRLYLWQYFGYLHVYLSYSSTVQVNCSGRANVKGSARKYVKINKRNIFLRPKSPLGNCSLMKHSNHPQMTHPNVLIRQSHRRRKKTEEKAKVVASVLGVRIYSISCRTSCFA